MLSEVDHLTGLSQRLLQLARADRGQLQLDRTPIDLAATCRSAVHRSSVAHGNHLNSHGADPLIVPADRIALEAVLDAVLENVARHGGGEAEIRWDLDGAHEAVVTIEDHGPGMTAGAHHRAFERFFRADPSRTRDTGGAGLGLALARALVEAQRGRMWLEPTPGGGLTASIALPLR